MMHPVHGSHQEHVALSSEIKSELRRYVCDHLIKHLFTCAFKPIHELFVHRTQQLASDTQLARISSGMGLPLSTIAVGRPLKSSIKTCDESMPR